MYGYGCQQLLREEIPKYTIYAERKRHARHNKQSGENILEGLRNLKDRICSFDNLMGAYRDAARGKRYRNEVLDFTFNLGENLLSIQHDLLNMKYTVGKYREFYVRYPKPRLVMALGFRDRIVQWAIYRQINPYLEKRYITHSYGCRKEKGTLKAAECLHNWQQLISRKADAGDWYIIKGDVSKYFYRVDHQKASEAYEEVAPEIWFSWLIGTIINNPDVPFGLPVGAKPDDCPRSKRLFDVGMPIGNLTSQETANLFLHKLDEFCKHILHLHFYVRYMDDFCIFIKGKDNARKAFEEIGKFLRENMALDISPKSVIQKATAPVEFVGYLITPHGIRLRKKTVRHMKRGMKHLMHQYAIGAIPYEKALESAVCYIGMCKNCNGYNMLRWIQDHFVLKRNEDMNDNNMPSEGRHFYAVHENESGTVDVYLRPLVEDPDDNINQTIYVIKDVEPFDGLEEDIRARYQDWCDSGELIIL